MSAPTWRPVLVAGLVHMRYELAGVGRVTIANDEGFPRWRAVAEVDGETFSGDWFAEMGTGASAAGAAKRLCIQLGTEASIVALERPDVAARLCALAAILRFAPPPRRDHWEACWSQAQVQA